MSKQDQKLMTAVVATAIYYCGNRYEVGEKIELSEQEFAELRPYLNTEQEFNHALALEKQAQAQRLEQQAELEHLALQAKVNELEQKHLQAESLVAAQGLEIAELNAELAEKQAEIDKLNAQINSKNATQAKTKNKVNKADNQDDDSDKVVS